MNQPSILAIVRRHEAGVDLTTLARLYKISEQRLRQILAGEELPEPLTPRSAPK